MRFVTLLLAVLMLPVAVLAATPLDTLKKGDVVHLRVGVSSTVSPASVTNVLGGGSPSGSRV